MVTPGDAVFDEGAGGAFVAGCEAAAYMTDGVMASSADWP
jgi:hypothetical protein